MTTDSGWHRLVWYQAQVAMDLLDDRGRLELGQLPLAELMAPEDSAEWSEWPGEPFYQPQTSRADDPVAYHAEGIISSAQQVMRAMRTGLPGLALSSMWGLSVHLHDLQACADLPADFAWPRWKHVRRGTAFRSGRRAGSRNRLYSTAEQIMREAGPSVRNDEVWKRLADYPDLVEHEDDLDNDAVLWMRDNGKLKPTSRKSFNNRLTEIRNRIFPDP